MRGGTEAWRELEVRQVARDALTLEVAVEAARIMLFRRHLQASVRWAAPLLVEALPPAVLAVALHRLAPPDDWPRVPLRTAPVGPMFAAYGKGVTHKSSRGPRRFMRYFLRHGLIVRDGEHPDGGLGIVCREERIDVGMTLGPITLMTGKGELRVEVPSALPETMIGAALGRRIGDLLGHELLDGREYPISRVARYDDRTTVCARIGDALYDMPWPHLLQH